MNLRTRAVSKLRRTRHSLHHRLAKPGSRPVHVFHHIPKTGGSTINVILTEWFYRVRDYRGRIDPNDWSKGHGWKPPLDLDTLRASDCLSGHWATDGSYIHERYPEIVHNPDYRIFTFVRDPLELKLSLHFFEKMRGKDIEGTLESELLGRPNYMAHRFPCTEDDYQEILSRYMFIGLTDRFQESADLLAEKLGKPRIDLPKKNRSRSGSERAGLSKDFIAEFRERNRLDYTIYEYCRARFDSHGGVPAGRD